MVVPKVVGLETEYGIHTQGPDANPTAASSWLINAYVADLAGRINWDFEDETPGQDARGYVRDGSFAPEIEMHLVNTVLTNGARYYVDHAHPEYSTPECLSALEALAFDRAGELILQRSMTAAKRLLPAGEEIVIYKNNSDGKGNSYGCHENYLLDRELPFAQLAREFTVHLVSRQIFTGAGKVGCEEPGSRRSGFEISQRADFFEEPIGLETTLKRPIINTRDEPHSDAGRYRRLHVITGDANLAEVATFLKIGTAALVLCLIEEGVLGPEGLVLADPVPGMHQVSHDLTLSSPLLLEDGRRLSALDLQWKLFDLASAYAAARGLEALGPPEVGALVLERWERVLSSLETEPAKLHRELDWVAKRELINAYCERHGCDTEDPRVQALDLQYHDLRPERSLFQRLGMERLVDLEVATAAMTDPPRTTRAYFRGQCLKRFAAHIVAANWDSIVFDLGEGPLRRVPMMDPLRGSAAFVDRLFEDAADPRELIDKLGGGTPVDGELGA